MMSQVLPSAPIAKLQNVANWLYRQYKMIGPLYKRDKEKVCPLTIYVLFLMRLPFPNVFSEFPRRIGEINSMDLRNIPF